MNFIDKFRMRSRMILASIAALAMVFSGVLPASALGASEIGRQEFTDPIDTSGSLGISRVEVSTHEPGSVNIFLYFDGVVAEGTFPGSTSYAWVDIDVDGDGSTDWFFGPSKIIHPKSQCQSTTGSLTMIVKRKYLSTSGAIILGSHLASTTIA